MAARLDFRAVMVARQQHKKKGMEIYLPPSGEDSGIFGFEGARAVLRRGLASEWTTTWRKAQ
jgi:hypothetical protein